MIKHPSRPENDSPATPSARGRVFARLVVASVGLASLASASAFAQTSGPPRVQQPDEPSSWLYYLVVGVLVAATVGASLIPSKRGHLD